MKYVGRDSSCNRNELPRLGVVTPLANERENIEAFLDAMLQHLQPNDRWFLVLDRVSRDGTREIVEARSRTDERIVYVWAPQCRCLVDAVFAGYEAAYFAGCKWILEIDAGFSHPPAKVPEFISAMTAGYDFVAGSRFILGGAHRSPWTRRLLSYGGTLLARTLLGGKMTDMTGAFLGFSRSAMKYLLEHRVRSRANFYNVEIHKMMQQFRWTEIPFVYVNNHYRVGRPAIGEALLMMMQMASATLRNK